VPTFSVIIVSWNVQAYLKRCLAALARERGSALKEVIVVDNTSTDGSVGLVSREFPWVRLIASERNLGFAAACNLAARQATATHLVLLNPDTEVAPGFFKQLATFWQTHPEAGAVGGRLVNEDGTPQPSVRGFPSLWSSMLDALKLLQQLPSLAPRYLARHFDYSKAAPVDQVMGACLSVPRTLWQAMGGLDEGFWLWFEEADLCKRLKDQGHQVWYDPSLQVRHTQAASFSQLTYLNKHRQFTRSLLRYLGKHRGPLAQSLVWLASRPWFVVAGVVDALTVTPTTAERAQSLQPLRWFVLASAGLAGLELASWLGWLVPSFGSVATALLGVLWLVVAARNLPLGVSLLLLELVVGSFGYLLSFKLGGLTLSLRHVLFLGACSILVWRLVTQHKFSLFTAGGLRWWYLGALSALGFGSAVALLHGRGLTDFFLDLNRYFYLLLFPLWLEAYRDERTWRYVKLLVPPALTWLALKTVVALYLFSHLTPEYTLGFYQWFRQTGFGEITYVSGTFFRIFSQSQVYAALGTTLGFAWLWASLQRPREWFYRLGCYLFLWLNLVTLLSSLSRSFWLGSAVAWGLVLLPALVKRRAHLGQYLHYLSTSVCLTLAALGLIISVTQVAWPLPPLSSLNASLFANRLAQGEAASSSRLALLPPLSRAILQHPLVGSGFGATVTFHSLDPRIVRGTAGGSGLTTTSAFEWGYLDLWLKLGLIGLLGYLGFFCYGLGPAARAWWRGTPTGSALALAALALLVVNITTPYLNHPLGIGALMALVAASWKPNAMV